MRMGEDFGHRVPFGIKGKILLLIPQPSQKGDKAKDPPDVISESGSRPTARQMNEGAVGTGRNCSGASSRDCRLHEHDTKTDTFGLPGNMQRATQEGQGHSSSAFNAATALNE